MRGSTVVAAGGVMSDELLRTPMKAANGKMTSESILRALVVGTGTDFAVLSVGGAGDVSWMSWAITEVGGRKRRHCKVSQ